MIEINIPGFKPLSLEHLVLDYNGTLAIDGLPIPGIAQRLNRLVRRLKIHILTADTFGKVRSKMSNSKYALKILEGPNQHAQKLAYVTALGAQRTVCIGNGRNDRRMLEKSILGICVIQREGAAREAMTAADIVAESITSALDLLLNRNRLIATLRS